LLLLKENKKLVSAERNKDRQRRKQKSSSEACVMPAKKSTNVVPANKSTKKKRTLPETKEAFNASKIRKNSNMMFSSSAADELTTSTRESCPKWLLEQESLD